MEDSFVSSVRDAAVRALDDNIESIVALNTKIAGFWSVAHGWAPKSAADLLSSAALDWQVDLSKSLRIWAERARAEQDCGDAPLLLAWANLGSLTEATLMWFVSVFHADFVRDPSAPKERDKVTTLAPGDVKLDRLRQFFDRVIWPEKESAAHRCALARIQQRRNAIHSFSRRELGDWTEWAESVADYLHILEYLEGHVPYPDEPT
jgi:hypothetical protein